MVVVHVVVVVVVAVVVITLSCRGRCRAVCSSWAVEWFCCRWLGSGNRTMHFVNNTRIRNLNCRSHTQL